MDDAAPDPAVEADVDLDELAARARRVLELPVDEATEVIVTLAEHRDRRVVEPLIDLLASRRANELVVRAAGWLADPALHAALVQLAATRLGELDPGYWEQVDAAIGRCHPDAVELAEGIEVGLLAQVQTSAAMEGLAVEIALDGAYPTTEVVFSLGERTERVAIWNFDELAPVGPATIDRQFTAYRLGTVASWF